MRDGIMAAWPDPVDPERKPVWQMDDDEAAASPLVRARAGFVEQCHAWRIAARDDGWVIRATYPEHESLEQAWTAERDGYVVQGIARPRGAHGARLPVASIHIWGPDRMAIAPPPVYDWDAIQRGVRTCLGCEAYPVDTVLVGFASRYCEPCAIRLRPSIEREGWCD